MELPSGEVPRLVPDRAVRLLGDTVWAVDRQPHAVAGPHQDAAVPPGRLPPAVPAVRRAEPAVPVRHLLRAGGLDAEPDGDLHLRHRRFGRLPHRAEPDGGPGQPPAGRAAGPLRRHADGADNALLDARREKQPAAAPIGLSSLEPAPVGGRRHRGLCRRRCGIPLLRAAAHPGPRGQSARRFRPRSIGAARPADRACAAPDAPALRPGRALDSVSQPGRLPVLGHGQERRVRPDRADGRHQLRHQCELH